MNLNASIYVPFVYITTTRLCQVANCDWIKDRNLIKIKQCHKECMTYNFILENPTIPSQLIMKGNTQYYVNSELSNLPKAVNRIVDQSLMM
jgi:hypothetical protein